MELLSVFTPLQYSKLPLPCTISVLNEKWCIKKENLSPFAFEVMDNRVIIKRTHKNGTNSVTTDGLEDKLKRLLQIVKKRSAFFQFLFTWLNMNIIDIHRIELQQESDPQFCISYRIIPEEILYLPHFTSQELEIKFHYENENTYMTIYSKYQIKE